MWRIVGRLKGHTKIENKKERVHYIYIQDAISYKFMTQDESQKLFTSESAREINQTHIAFVTKKTKQNKAKSPFILIYREGN